LKKTLLFLLFLLGLPFYSHASDIAGAETLGKGKFSLGLDGEYVFKRKLKAKGYQDNLTLRGAGPGGSDVFFRMQSNSDSPDLNKFYRPMTKISYGILDNLDVYVKLGTNKGKINQVDSGAGLEIMPGFATVNYEIISSNTRYNIDTAFNWGAGLKGAYPVDLLGGFILGCDLQYLRSESDYYAMQERVSYIGPPASMAFSWIRRWSGRLTIQEWHAAPYIAKKFGKFTPYLGAEYSDVRIKDKPKGDVEEMFIPAAGGDVTAITTQGYVKEYKSKSIVGGFIGLDYNINNNWKFNLEGSFINAYVASLEMAYKF